MIWYLNVEWHCWRVNLPVNSGSWWVAGWSTHARQSNRESIYVDIVVRITWQCSEKNNTFHDFTYIQKNHCHADHHHRRLHHHHHHHHLMATTQWCWCSAFLLTLFEAWSDDDEPPFPRKAAKKAETQGEEKDQKTEEKDRHPSEDHLGTEKNPGCLGYIGDYTSQVLYRDYNKPS